MTSQLLQKVSKSIAALSFIRGCIIFIAYYFTALQYLALIGLSYILIAGIINLFLLILLLLRAYKDQQNRAKLLRTSGLL